MPSNQLMSKSQILYGFTSLIDCYVSISQCQNHKLVRGLTLPIYFYVPNSRLMSKPYPISWFLYANGQVLPYQSIAHATAPLKPSEIMTSSSFIQQSTNRHILVCLCQKLTKLYRF